MKLLFKTFLLTSILFFSFSILALDKIVILRGGGEDYGRDRIKSILIGHMEEVYGRTLVRDQIHIFNKYERDEGLLDDHLRQAPSIQGNKAHIFKLLTRKELILYIAYSEEIRRVQEDKILIEYFTKDRSIQSIQLSMDYYYGILFY